MDTVEETTPAPTEVPEPSTAMIPLEELLKLAWWEPRYDRIFVLKLVKATASKAGIVGAGENRELPEQGIVLAIGPGGLAPETGREIHVVSKPGDLVLFGKYAGQDTTTPLVMDVAPPQLIAMRDIEVLAAKPLERYAWNDLFICHDHDPRKIHFAGHTCDDCPRVQGEDGLRELQAIAYGEPGAVIDAEVPDAAPGAEPSGPSALIEEERAKMRQRERAREQAGELPAAGTIVPAREGETE